jgi:hypothetical protein
VLSTNDPTVDSNWKKVQLDVVGAINGQTITPGQVGESSNRSKIFADEIDISSSFEAVGISSGSLGSPADPLNYSGGMSPAVRVSTTTITADGTDKPILDVSSRSNGLIIVSGQVGGNAEQFVDLVLISGFTSISQINSQSRFGPGGRTYGNRTNPFRLTVAVAGSGQSYEISAIYIGALS